MNRPESLRSFNDFLTEKKSPYKKATLEKYKRQWERGESIPFGVETSLKSQGMIPRESGERIVSKEYEANEVLKKAVRESFEETMGTAEINWSCKDKDGKMVEIKEVDGTGMAGEPMIFAYVYHDSKLSSEEKVKSHLSPNDYKEMKEYLDDISSNNQASAISWVV